MLKVIIIPNFKIDLVEDNIQHLNTYIIFGQEVLEGKNKEENEGITFFSFRYQNGWGDE